MHTGTSNRNPCITKKRIQRGDLHMSKENLKQNLAKFKNTHRRNMLGIALIPLVLIAVASCIISIVTTNSLMNNSMSSDLKALAYSIRDTYNQLNDEPYVNKGSDESPNVYKGQYNIGKHSDIVDTLYHNADMVSTVFWNNTRIMTSLKDDNGNRMTGTTLEDKEILTDVLKNGEEHFDANFKIDGHSYYVYYLPLYQADSESEIVGMIFVGASAEHVNKMMITGIGTTIGVSLFILIIAAVIITIFITRITRALGRSVNVLNRVAEGDLSVAIPASDLKRRDEFGNLMNSVASLRDELVTIISDLKANSSLLLDSSLQLEQVAKETETTVEQVEKAVEDIAQGATSQAQETQRASEDVIVMGDLINKTSSETQELDDTSSSMKLSSDEASDTLVELKKSNLKSIDAINVIAEQTNTTNESALKIQEATHLITSIAEETNLLSLNASIEAARAGEQGRGFAVVAGQIQKLAEQSNEAALKIDEITASLINDSEKAVKTMQDVKEIMNNQSKSVERTERMFDTVKKGIDQSFEKVQTITTHTESLDASRVSIVDIVQNLTAVAEENAASTQETSAAAAEVTATVSNISDAALNLKQIASDLEEHMSHFKL